MNWVFVYAVVTFIKMLVRVHALRARCNRSWCSGTGSCFWDGVACRFCSSILDHCPQFHVSICGNRSYKCNVDRCRLLCSWFVFFVVGYWYIVTGKQIGRAHV